MFAALAVAALATAGPADARGPLAERLAAMRAARARPAAPPENPAANWTTVYRNDAPQRALRPAAVPADGPVVDERAAERPAKPVDRPRVRRLRPRRR